ncbi:tyrosine-type recombinase/integrase [Microbacterium sp. SSM24]|uniref:tyrosine-type recombinase/integrase n=1 Tax=Microbacterium sp. SSM24 TaxID=2991714 RepID=UPI0022261F11|nr:site-specific integrase [Microbacterium sp. SSM24]MCW3493584.1 site-specific integrase [Microbacterium sp. SSM24]
MRLDSAATTLAEFFGEFRALVEDGLTSNAVQAYARAWTIRVEPTLGALPLAELRPLTIAKARALWTGAESTKGDAVALLSKILELAVMDGLLPANPCRSLPHSRGKARESEWTSRALDDLQVQRMLSLTSFHPSGQRALAGLAFTGLRLGELVGLRWEDLNEHQHYFTVRRTFSPDGHGRLEERPTKSGKSRQVPILEELTPWLDAARSLGREHIFTGKLGGPFDSTNLSRALRWPAVRDQIATFADGQPLRFHDLRHTFLSRLARQGVAPAHIQKVAGHASITTTERYTHISGTEAALAVRDAVNGANREVTFRGGESAAHTGQTRQNPRKSGGFDL